MIHGGPQGGPVGGAEAFKNQRTPSRGPEDMDVDAIWAADLLGESSHLVGHSYGGLVALAAAGLRPAAVRSLTLIEAPVFAAAEDDPDVQAGQVEQERILSADLEPLARLMAFGAFARIPRDELATPTRDQLIAMGEGLSQMRSPSQWDGRAALDKIIRARIPVLAVTGGWSPRFDAIGKGLAAYTSGQHLVVESSHHFPQLIEARFNVALDAFMRTAEKTYAERSRPLQGGA
jgi:pimeloyl-ACP methyl ester carboxylesterase